MGRIRQALGLEVLSAAPSETGPLGDYSANVSPPARSTGASSLTVDRAVSSIASYRSIQLIAGMGSQLKLNSWRRSGTELVDPAPGLVRKPDVWRSRGSFLRRYLTNAATEGNNFLLKRRLDGPNSPVVSVELLDPFSTWIRWEKGVKLYDTYDPRTGKPATFTDAEVLHVWCGLELPGHDRALGPIAACRIALANHLDVRDYAAGWFAGETGDVPSGVLSTDQILDPVSAAEIKRAWIYPEDFDRDGQPIRHGGPKVRVIGRGATYTPVMLKPSDAQWLESQNFGVLDTARLWGLPSDYLEAAVEGSSLVYSSLPMLDGRFLRTTLFPVYLTPLEEAITELLPNGQEARFDAGELLRPDPKARAEIDQIYLPLGVYDAQHVRDREGIAGPAPTIPAPAPRPATQEVPQ